MTPTTFVYCGSTSATISSRLRTLLFQASVDSELMYHAPALPGQAAGQDLIENLDAAYLRGGCVQLVYDSCDPGTAELFSRHLRRAPRKTRPGSWEIAILCSSEDEEENYARILTREMGGATAPLTWSLIAESGDPERRLNSFTQLLAALAITERPSRMDRFDSLSTLRGLGGKLISNRIYWFDVPRLEWMATVLLKGRLWLDGHGTRGRLDALAEIEELLSAWVGTLPRRFGVSALMSSAQKQSFALECVPKLYAITAECSDSSVDTIETLQIIGRDLLGGGFGSKQLRSHTAAQVLEELCLDLRALGASIQLDTLKLRTLTSASQYLSGWLTDCEAVLSESMALLRRSSWSPVSLVPSSTFVRLGSLYGSQWDTATNQVREQLRGSFIRWKHRETTRLQQDFPGSTRALEFVPAELSTNFNEELWPLKENVAVIVQKEIPLK